MAFFVFQCEKNPKRLFPIVSQKFKINDVLLYLRLLKYNR